MDIEFTDEQELLRSSVQKMLRGNYAFEARQGIAHSEEGWSRSHWREFAEAGLLSAPFSEEVGGLGEGPIATMIIMEEFGRRLVVEPFFETVVVAGGLLEDAGSPEQQRQHIPEIMSGEAIWTLATFEAGSRYDLHVVATKAERQDGGFVLRGGKAVVTAAPFADKFIVSARTSGAPADRDGVTLFVVDRQSANLHLKSFKTLDGRRAAEVSLDGVRVEADAVLGGEGKAIEVLERCRDRAIAALSAEAVGAMRELNDATVEYSKTRKQFGVPLGSFQVLQHRMVDMFVALEEGISMTYLLNSALAARGVPQAQLAAATKVKVGEVARHVGEQAIQLHGGMGMSDELNVGHYFKRLLAINIQFGDPAYHLTTYARAAEAA
ncbi:acyl-CoA dehydrogenase family protein [Bradyrhizobium prioriisuperbiae]|uniref:acyl-CoA dehydrogenase family protein n=1 Tax=Bradyrhizobium prioriisuperbiae TaxID=2854389 RepID=UPI0028EA02BF|nr:acyl-CoA dehydrogenase family protein [Bradyrhizobium prioritasuperba]